MRQVPVAAGAHAVTTCRSSGTQVPSDLITRHAPKMARTVFQAHIVNSCDESTICEFCNTVIQAKEKYFEAFGCEQTSMKRSREDRIEDVLIRAWMIDLWICGTLSSLAHSALGLTGRHREVAEVELMISTS